MELGVGWGATVDVRLEASVSALGSRLIGAVPRQYRPPWRCWLASLISVLKSM